MLLIICLGFMFGGAVIAGLTAGKTLKRFFVGVKIVMLSALPLIFLAVFKMDTLEKSCVSYLQQRSDYSDLSEGAFVSNLITAPGILSLFIAVFILIAFSIYIAAFNCRKNTNNIYVAVSGTIFAGIIIYFCPIWGFYGLSTFIQFSQRYLNNVSALISIPATIILTATILTAWTIFSFRSKRQGWKTLSVQIALFAGIYATIWLLAFTTAYFYGRYALNQAHKNGVIPHYWTYKLPEEAQAEKDNIARFIKEHKNFEMPYKSAYHWTKNSSKNHRKRLISQAKREYTLKHFNSADFDEFYRSREKLLEYYAQAKNKNILLAPILNDIRSYVRTHAGKAALYKETNQPDKILPELMKVIWIDAELLNDSPFIIVELVRIACRSVWYTAMVQVGPNDKKYAPVYREALEFMKSRRIYLPHEAGYFLYMLSNDIYAHLDIKPKSYTACLVMPSAIIRAAKGLLNSIAIQQKLKKMEKQEVFGDSEQPLNNTTQNYRLPALKSRTTIVVGTTALALKLYRVEHGAYPDKLEGLIPEYLDSIPSCPSSGEPLKYESDGRNFTLSYGAEKYRDIYKLTSIPTY